MSLTQTRLHEVLSYNPETGSLIWKESKRDRLGKPAGWRHSKGYCSVVVDGKQYFAHRLAWLYVHGHLPSKQIDHIDGVKSNNAILNLREASNAENHQNVVRAKASNRSSGILGAHLHKKSGRWRSSICIDGKQIHLGFFPSAADAHAAYLKAKRVLHPFGAIANGN